jgi:hypothetical protein
VRHPKLLYQQEKSTRHNPRQKYDTRNNVLDNYYYLPLRTAYYAEKDPNITTNVPNCLKNQCVKFSGEKKYDNTLS